MCPTRAYWLVTPAAANRGIVAGPPRGHPTPTRHCLARAGSACAGPTSRAIPMSKEQRSSREDKKKALLTPKEKKAAKKAKKSARDVLGVDRTR